MRSKTDLTGAFWWSFVGNGGPRHGDYVVVALGDSPSMATELAALIVSGRKRATCSLARDYAAAPANLPKAGDFVVVVDGNDIPQCIWRTTEVEIKPLTAVDDRFAWDEGEGDQSHQSWLAAHRSYFARQAAREGFEMHDAILAVFERFEIVWPETSENRDESKSDHAC